MPVTATAAVALAAGLDTAFGEPPARIHPVALLGRIIARFDRSSDDGEPAQNEWAHPRLVGVLAALVLPVFAAGVAAAVVVSGARVNPWLGSVLAGLVLFSTTSLRLLLGSARDVIDESEADPDCARTDLRALAGRDAASLDAAHLRSAAVESLAENLADGLIAPLFAFAVVAAVAGGVLPASPSSAVPLSPSGVVPAAAPLALAAGAAAWTKAVNTLDSMLGYRSKPVGWASAKLDDAAMWLPARLSALLLGVAAGSPALPFRRRVRTLARQPASPNSGWPMATMAALLPARLHKPGAYDLDPGKPRDVGERGKASAGDAAERRDAELPDVATATRAVSVTRRAGFLAFALAGVIAWF